MAFSDSARKFVDDVGRVNVIVPLALAALGWFVLKGRLRPAALVAAGLWGLGAVLYSSRSVSATVTVPEDEIGITYH